MKRPPIDIPPIMRAGSRAAAPAARTSRSAPAPSPTLLTAALAGFLSVGLAACNDEKTTSVEDAGEDVTPWRDSGQEDEQDSGREEDEPDAAREEEEDAGGDDAAVDVDAGTLDGPEVLSETEGDVAFSVLRSDCDDRGGYVQVHASCSGSNDCAGFSYGDWDPGVLSEHTCAGANGCVGLSCVVLPPDSGKTPDEILFDPETLPAGGPQPCWFCHAESQHQDDGSYIRDRTKFKVWIAAGSTRNEQNWLDLSPAAQEAIVAFGAIGRIGPPGQETSVVSMKGYHKLYSRAEIQRVVEHLRTLTPIIKVIEAPP